MFKKKGGIAQGVSCNFCNIERDSIQLCMWRCQHVKLFWNKLEGFICDHCNNVQNLKFNEKIILFGTDDNFKSDSVLDFIILYAKYFIYSCRYEKIKPQKGVEKRYEIEAHNQKLKLTLPDFLSDWAYYKSVIMLE